MRPRPRRCQARPVPACYVRAAPVPETSEFLLIALIALVSLVVTYVGAAVGLVLGHLRLIFLVIWLGPIEGAATSLAISAVGAIVGALRHAREGRVEGRLLLSLGAPSALAAFITATLAPHVEPRLIKAAIAVTLVVSGAAMLVKERRRPPPPDEPAGTRSGEASAAADEGAPASAPAPAPVPELSRRALTLEILAGAGLGALSGLIGLLLGTLRLPVLLRLARTPARAVGTNMAIGALTGAFAGVAALREGSVDLVAFGVLAPITVVAAHFGARTTGALRRETLVALIAWILVGTGVMMSVELLRG